MHNKLLFSRGFSFMGNHGKEMRKILHFGLKQENKSSCFLIVNEEETQKQKQKIARVNFSRGCTH